MSTTKSILEKQILYLESIGCDVASVNNTIMSQRVMLIGCGGTGSVIAPMLSGMGFNKFMLVDDDLVQPNNLNRQLYYGLSDSGQPKVQVLKKILEKHNPANKIEFSNSRVASSVDIVKLINYYSPTIIVCCADSPPILIQKWIVDATTGTQITCIFGAVGIESGTLGPLLDTDAAKISYSKVLSILEKRFTEPGVVSGSVGTTNMLVAAAMVHDIFLYYSNAAKPACMNKRVQVEYPLYKQNVVWSYTD